MRDVTAVRIAVTQGDLDDTVPLLRAGGFVVRPCQGGVLALRGGTTIRLDVVAREHAGMKRLEFSLNHPVAYRHVEPIGHSTLVVGPGPRAVWTFA